MRGEEGLGEEDAANGSGRIGYRQQFGRPFPRPFGRSGKPYRRPSERAHKPFAAKITLQIQAVPCNRWVMETMDEVLAKLSIEQRATIANAAIRVAEDIERGTGQPTNEPALMHVMTTLVGASWRRFANEITAPARPTFLAKP